MRQIISLLSALTLLPLMSCVDERNAFDDSLSGTLGREVIINASLPEEQSGTSRISSTDTGSKIQLMWETGDRLVAFGFNDANAFVGKSSFELIPNSLGKFKGKLVRNATDYVLYYEAAKLAVDGANGTASMNYDGQVQTLADSPAHLKETMLIVSDKISEELLIASTFVMHPKNSVFLFNLKSKKSELGDVKRLAFTAGDSKEVPLSVSAPSSKFYLSFDPNQIHMEQGGKLSVSLKGGYDYKVSITSTKGVDYQPGCLYTAEITFDDAGRSQTLWNWQPVEVIQVQYAEGAAAEQQEGYVSTVQPDGTVKYETDAAESSTADFFIPDCSKVTSITLPANRQGSENK